MRPIATLDPVRLRRLKGLLFDLDDTVLDHGQLSIEAYAALFRLKKSGLLLVGVTGRSAAWGQLLARQWPVDGMVTENGIIALKKEDNRIRIYDRVSEAERKERRAQLMTLGEEIQSRWPDLTPADDAFGRIADTAFDIAESKTVPRDVVQAAARFASERGAKVVISSIQLHLSLDHDDKATGVLRFLNQAFQQDPTEARARFAFIGDSQNDAACFAGFETSVGVSNLQGRPTLTPRFITRGARGRGFVEFAELLVRHRV